MTVTRFQQKRGTSAQWAAENPVLRDGEFGVDKDTGVIKLGDGFTVWSDLPAIMGSQYLPLLGTAHDSYRLGGLLAEEYLRADGTAVDSDKLNGHDSSYFLQAIDSAQFLPVNGKAADSDKLDGLDSTSFLKVGDVPAKSADSDLLDGLDSTVFAKATDVNTMATSFSAQVMTSSPTRMLVTHWGAGAGGFPVVATNGVLPGDTWLRTDVGTNGSIWTYVGGTSGKNGWVHKGPIVCTSTTRPPSGVLYAGIEIFETDTGRLCFWNAAWRNGGIGINRTMYLTSDVLSGAEFQLGMWKGFGNGANAMAVPITFPVPFAAAPLAVFANPFGFKAGPASYTPESTTNWEGWSAVAGEVTTTTMTVRLKRTDGATFSTSTDYYFNWMAIGQK